MLFLDELYNGFIKAINEFVFWSRVTSRGSRVNGRGSRVTSRGSKHSSQLFLNVGKSKFRVTCVSGFCFILHTMCFLACSRLSLVGTS